MINEISLQKEKFLKKMDEIKNDIDTFSKIDFSNFDQIDFDEYSKVITTLGKMLEKFEGHDKEISDLLHKDSSLKEYNSFLCNS